MKTTVSGTDDLGQHHVSQTATSSEAKLDAGPVRTPNQHIAYTTAQLHENIKDYFYLLICGSFLEGFGRVASSSRRGSEVSL